MPNFENNVASNKETINRKFVKFCYEYKFTKHK